MPAEASPGRWWYARVGADAASPARLISVRSDLHPDGTVVDLDVSGIRADDVACSVEFGPQETVVALRPGPAMGPAGPPLWFLEIAETAAAPPAINLVAFPARSDGPRTGDLVDPATGAEVSSVDQVGALRWYPATGEVDQIYVQPAWRRRGIAGVLLISAGALSVARGWARLWGDGQRTELGEQLRHNSPWRHRAADLTHLAPPMTPGEPG